MTDDVSEVMKKFDTLPPLRRGPRRVRPFDINEVILVLNSRRFILEWGSYSEVIELLERFRDEPRKFEDFLIDAKKEKESGKT